MMLLAGERVILSDVQRAYVAEAQTLCLVSITVSASLGQGIAVIEQHVAGRNRALRTVG